MSGMFQSTLFDLSDSSVFPLDVSIRNAIEKLALESNPDVRGAVYTRREVVEFILDLVGYMPDCPLYNKSILEPSFGNGDFLLPIIDRLLESWRNRPTSSALSLETLSSAIFAVELHKATFDSTRLVIIKKLQNVGISKSEANKLVGSWLQQGDFLIETIDTKFDFVVGNPPYVRQELIPAVLLAEYKSRYKTIYDRADLYIPFIERSLTLLKNSGLLGLICSNRWMKNRYGMPLRSFVAQGYHLKCFVDMEETDAFNSCVSAYPAITVFCKQSSGGTRVANRPAIDKKELGAISREMTAKRISGNSAVKEIQCVVNIGEPWIFETSSQIALVRRIEREYARLEDAGCKVGIGVATGADKAFIGNYDLLDVEPDRKLRLVKTDDIKSGEIEWKGQGVINPFSTNGTLVDLQEYPKLDRFLDSRRDVIMNRHCARKTPTCWYRTIDRIWADLATEPKLLIPDIKGEAHVVYEPGRLYPHHNLYYVTSDSWSLRALQAVLLSKVTNLFVSTYSTKMRGGYLRFQAQYLRRIRIPLWQDVPSNLRKELETAAVIRDIKACNLAVGKLYNISKEEQSVFNN